MDGMIGEIRMFTGSFAPRGWRFCDGSLLRIHDHSALFSIIGLTWGGDGRHNFALPDLQGRIPVGAGAGTGLTDRKPGTSNGWGGPADVRLETKHLPPHRHTVAVSSSAAGSGTDAVAAESTATFAADGGQSMDAEVTTLGSGGEPHPNLPPYTATHYIICVEGVFPRRRH